MVNLELNRKIVCISLIAIVALSSACIIPLISADWMGAKKGEPNQDVYQETCGPNLLPSSMTCQQANYMIKQNAQLLADIEGRKN